MPQYFDSKPTSSSKKREIEFNFLGRKLVFISDNGVFSKNEIDEGTTILLSAVVPYHLEGRILDLGCAYGAIGLTVASFNLNAHVVCADVNERAVELCRQNAIRLHVQDRVETIVSNRFQNLNGTFNSILINPPIRAGKKITYAMYKEAYDHLIDNGSMIIVIRKAQGAPSALEYLESIFSSVIVIKKSRGYWIIKAIKQANKSKEPGNE